LTATNAPKVRKPKGFLWSRISYGAQELAVFLLDHSPSNLERSTSKGRKRDFPSLKKTRKERR
jgi:hypothetical protein